VSQLAAFADPVNALTIVGSNLYWVDLSHGIMTLPVTGGTPTMVLSDASIDGNLATDGTLLYFTSTPMGTTASTLMSVSLSGSGETTLASGFAAPNSHSGSIGTASVSSLASQLFVVGGQAYLNATIRLGGVNPRETIISIPTAGGGTPTDLFASLSNVEVGVQDLAWADSSGLYFENDGGDIGTGSLVFLGYAPLTGGTISQLWVPTSAYVMGATYFEPVGGELAISGGSAYFIARPHGEETPATLTSLTFFGAPPPTGPAAAVQTYPSEAVCGVVSDAHGMYMLEDGDPSSQNGAIFTVDPSTGAQTLAYTPDFNGYVTPYTNVLDAQNLYFQMTLPNQLNGFAIYALPR
jgi:hypothetical protein